MLLPLSEIKQTQYILHYNVAFDVYTTIEKDGSVMWIWLGNGSGEYYYRVYGARTDITDIKMIDLEDCAYQAEGLFQEWHKMERDLLQKYRLPTAH